MVFFRGKIRLKTHIVFHCIDCVEKLIMVRYTTAQLILAEEHDTNEVDSNDKHCQCKSIII